jgi:hypothetical protein
MREALVVILGIHRHRRAKLFLVGEAGAGTRLLPRLGEDGEEDRRENGDDGDHHKQFDQRKAGSAAYAARCFTDVQRLRSHGPSSVVLKSRMRAADCLIIRRLCSGSSVPKSPQSATAIAPLSRPG